MDLLRSIVTDQDSISWIDGVLYTTLKNEGWNGNLISEFSDYTSVDGLITEIYEQLGFVFGYYFDGFDQAFETLSSKRILICIDNLETVLRDNVDLFYSLVDRFPASWKVVVTSRVAVDGAHIYTLKELDQASSVKLARLYNKGRGGDDLDQDRYIELVNKCHFNPLAIKMTIDLYISGNDIPSSVNVAKHNIAQFSFKNLYETISDDAKKILALVLVKPNVSRIDVCEILELTVDESVSAINELSRTSLIDRIMNGDVEVYELNGSIEDFLIMNDSGIDFRNEITNKIKIIKNISNEIAKSQENKNIPEWHFQFIPNDCESGLKTIMAEFSKIRFGKNSSKDTVRKVYGKFKSKEEYYNRNKIFLRSMGKLCQELTLHSQAQDYYSKALSCDPCDIVTLSLYARFNFDSLSDYSESEKLYRNIVSGVDLNALDESSIKFYSSSYKSLFLSLIYQGMYDQVISMTTRWKDYSKFRIIFGTSRAIAFKRKAEKYVNSNYEEFLNCMKSSVGIMDDVYREGGYGGYSCTNGLKIIEEIRHCFMNDAYLSKYQSKSIDLLKFCETHIQGIYSGLEQMDEDTFHDHINFFHELNCVDNPFHNSKLVNSIKSREKKKNGFLLEVGGDHISVRVVRTVINKATNKRKAFLFAADTSGVEYFINYASVKDSTWNDWCNIDIGDEIIVLKSLAQEDKTALDVQECLVI